MTIYAVGGEADTFYPVTGLSFAYDTTGGHFLATASRGAMKIEQAVSEIELNFKQNVTTAYMHMHLYQEVADQAVADWLQIKKLDGSEAFRVALNSDGTWSVQKFKGSVWSVSLATTPTPVISNSAADIDIFIDVAVAGAIKIWKDGVSILDYSGDTTIDNTNFGRLHWKGQTGITRELSVSQVIVADERTVGWRLQTLTPTADGGETAWTGAFTDIDEFVLNTGDFIESNIVGQIETYAMSDIDASFSTFNVKAVVVAMRASNDAGSAIADLQATVRLANVNHFSPNLALTKNGNDFSIQYAFETNPSTTNAWIQSEVNGAETGVKSV